MFCITFLSLKQTLIMLKTFIFPLIVFLFTAISLSAEQRVYWSTSNAPTQGVYSARLDGTDVRTVISFVTNVAGSPRIPGAIAIDDIAGRLYIADTSTTLDIISTDLNGGDVRQFVDEGVSITDVTVDPFTAIVYWSTGTGYVGRKRPGLPVDQTFPGQYSGVAVAPISSHFFFGSASKVYFYELPGWASNTREELASTAYVVDRIEQMHSANQLTWVNPTNNRLMARRVGEASDRPILQFPTNDFLPLAMSYDRSESRLFYTNTTNNKIYVAPMSSFNVANPPQTFMAVQSPKGIAISCGLFAPNADDDSRPDCDESCPNDPAKISPGVCGCGVSEADTDGDKTLDCQDGCVNDVSKTIPGACGCGVADTDTDTDGTANCNDLCSNDPLKIMPGACGCGLADTDADHDGTADCNDLCINDPLKVSPGTCGCNIAEVPGCGIPTATPTSTPVVAPDLRDLTPGLKITLPPEVAVQENDIVIVFEKFLNTILNKPRTSLVLEAKTAKITSRYVVTVKDKTLKSKTVYKVSTKRNQLALKNLKPGNYSVNYKAEILKNGDVAGKTGVSPTAKFSIGSY